jgi:alpha-1,4-galacturonosyltransferase
MVGLIVLGKNNIWRPEIESENSNSTLKLIQDQLTMDRMYASITRSRNRRYLQWHEDAYQRKLNILGEENLYLTLHHT